MSNIVIEELEKIDFHDMPAKEMKIDLEYGNIIFTLLMWEEENDDYKELYLIFKDVVKYESVNYDWTHIRVGELNKIVFEKDENEQFSTELVFLLDDISAPPWIMKILSKGIEIKSE